MTATQDTAANIVNIYLIITIIRESLCKITTVRRGRQYRIFGILAPSHGNIYPF